MSGKKEYFFGLLEGIVSSVAHRSGIIFTQTISGHFLKVVERTRRTVKPYVAGVTSKRGQT